MIEVSIENKEGKVLFSCKGESIDSTYNKEYAGGDRIVIIKKATEYMAVQLDEYIAERFLEKFKEINRDFESCY